MRLPSSLLLALALGLLFAASVQGEPRALKELPIRNSYIRVDSPADCKPRATTNAAECHIKAARCERLYSIPMSYYWQTGCAKDVPLMGCQCENRCALLPGYHGGQCPVVATSSPTTPCRRVLDADGKRHLRC